MIKRKKKTIDGTDREILRFLDRRYPGTASGALVAKSVDLTSSAIAPRLDNLKTQGIIKPKEIQGLRTFNRTFPNKKNPVKIKAPRSILWGLDFKPKSRKKK